jgi:exopolysaccharide production protein ExoZ
MIDALGFIGGGLAGEMRTIVSVQALRAIAALAVALCHFEETRIWLQGRIALPLLEQLASGVDLFFVISGFIMVHSSSELFTTKAGARTFFMRRVARIIPPYWIVTTIAIPLMSLHANWTSLLGSYLFIPYRTSDGDIVPIYGVGWTLNFEMYFYVLFSAVIFMRKSVAVVVLCVTFCTIVLLGRWLQPTWTPLQFWSDPIILEFAFGMILALLYERQIQLPTALRICLIGVGIVVIAFFNTEMPPTRWRIAQWGIPTAMIFAGTVLGKEINLGWLRGVVKTLGDSSYALYLTHSLMLAAILLGWPYGLNQYPMMAVLFLGLVAIQLISIATFRLFERRSNKFLQQVLVPRRLQPELP